MSKPEQRIGRKAAPPISFRPEAGIREALEALAKLDDRSVSWVIGRALKLYIKLRQTFPNERASE